MTRTQYPPVPNNSSPIAPWTAEINSVISDKKGNIRFKVLLSLPDGSQVSITGFRYFPETDELKPPCYRVGKGWQPTVELSGPILEKLHQGSQKNRH
jgi:hypothetical protein